MGVSALVKFQTWQFIARFATGFDGELSAEILALHGRPATRRAGIRGVGGVGIRDSTCSHDSLVWPDWRGIAYVAGICMKALFTLIPTISAYRNRHTLSHHKDAPQ